ncbi:CPBP family intramembrane metalloprotease [Synechococcales cyanobacterium C]|uniref:CPBP family intramembrane metalloprotease n=2 Tax=Petrachloros TaxID=2918834 RepID=A0A8K2A8Q9_9CYAN|nr:CPBP family intramembrane glutamic endopeptidase [Petrachloros mirabilis]NCJ08314.1 CPBP family intramembrane metalloprotease [Petrachloros mirabilis ULC683]
MVFSNAPTPQLEPLSRMQVLIAMGVTAVALLLVAKIWMQVDPMPSLPLHWQTADLLSGALIGLGITGASAILYRVWPQYRASADLYLALVLKPLLWPDLIWLGLLPGLSEELLFRGVMLPSLGLNWTGVGISSVCFGILHFSGRQQWPYVIWATLVGGLLGYSALATGNLLVPVAAHILTNLIASASWKVLHNQHPQEES